jgi:hypothetical protein
MHFLYSERKSSLVTAVGLGRGALALAPSGTMLAYEGAALEKGSGAWLMVVPSQSAGPTFYPSCGGGGEAAGRVELQCPSSPHVTSLDPRKGGGCVTGRYCTGDRPAEAPSVRGEGLWGRLALLLPPMPLEWGGGCR